ncbi:MAG: hypothetical protein DI533_04540 [Cereibacter sphaeroides]|uniref:Uncharacterized protein n=1 Tax=Cereibacter sphaeroides TaxID=1063 RepID=A0A2W5SJQ8_CERSP|nr:MAG: hypothetical protein DI533_04540 [Cereibacter sphaeroides]
MIGISKNPAVLAAAEHLARTMFVETAAGRFDGHAWSLYVFDGVGPAQSLTGGCDCETCRLAIAASAAVHAGMEVPWLKQRRVADLQIAVTTDG